MRRVYYLLGSTKFSAKSQRPRNEGALGYRTRFERERDHRAGVRSDQREHWFGVRVSGFAGGPV